jgi:hypothetical protein
MPSTLLMLRQPRPSGRVGHQSRLIGADDGRSGCWVSVPGEALGAAWSFALLTLDRATRALHPATISSNPVSGSREPAVQSQPRPTPSLPTLTLRRLLAM